MPFYVISGLFALLLIIFLASPTLFNNFLTSSDLDKIADAPAGQEALYAGVYESLKNVRIDIFKADVIRSLIYLILGIGTIYFGFKNDKFSKTALVPVLALLILIDLLSCRF